MSESGTFLGRPVRSLQTMLRVISRAIPEIPPVIPDGVYGQSTMRAVTALQRYADLKDIIKVYDVSDADFRLYNDMKKERIICCCR